MTPTNKLRFVEREMREYYDEGFARVFKQRVLQQWWEIANTINIGFGDINVTPPQGEWRDVPLEDEHANG